MNPVDTSHLDMVAISSPDDASINWTTAFASYGGHGAENTVVVPFAIAHRQPRGDAVHHRRQRRAGARRW